ncbi:MAG TPA: hypothetical protein VLE99_05080 [Candidatus Saccharimonadales bacterium]|nr:hypothetical protein [Candidatus Saccharimonadales bacterium]
MHPTQQTILDSLRQGSSRQFSELLRDVAETSDNLTYHLKQLQKSGFIDSPAKGEYVLAQKGLVYLNNNLELNHDLFPTVSCMLELHNSDGAVLVMRKHKQPYLGSLHLPTFGVTSSQTLPAQIDEFLRRYRVAGSDLTFRGVHRERQQSGDLFVFDKFFVVFRGKFASFEQTVDDREFLALPPDELAKGPHLLSASKTVLALGHTADFTEATTSHS